MKITTFLFYKSIEVEPTELEEVMTRPNLKPVRYWILGVLGFTFKKPKEQE